MNPTANENADASQCPCRPAVQQGAAGHLHRVKGAREAVWWSSVHQATALLGDAVKRPHTCAELLVAGDAVAVTALVLYGWQNPQAPAVDDVVDQLTPDGRADRRIAEQLPATLGPAPWTLSRLGRSASWALQILPAPTHGADTDGTLEKA